MLLEIKKNTGGADFKMIVIFVNFLYKLVIKWCEKRF